MSITRKHFQELADALYHSMPTGEVISRTCADGYAVAMSQWRETRRMVGNALRRMNPRFNRDRFDYWTEHGESEATTRNRRHYVVQGNYGHGWEDIDTHSTDADATDSLAVYDREEPNYPHRKVTRRGAA